MKLSVVLQRTAEDDDSPCAVEPLCLPEIGLFGVVRGIPGHAGPRPSLDAARSVIASLPSTLADAEPVRAGEVIRIRTTGGGGWGDPLERDPALVVRDVVWRKVSPSAALADYGVVLTGSLEDDTLGFDVAATAARRSSLAQERGAEAFFDRGPGFRRLGGADAAEVDWL